MMRLFNILQNIAFIKACYAYALIRGKAKERPNEIKKILIIQSAKMGDMVCSTPVVHALRTKFPKAFIAVVGDTIGKQILESNSDVDEYYINSKNFLVLLRQIRKERFDASIVLVPDSRAIALSFLGSAKIITSPEVIDGYCPWQTKTYRLLRRLVRTAPHHMGKYAPREYLRLLEPLGIYTNDTKKYLSYSDSARKNANAFLRAHSLTEKKFAIISPSAGNKIKNWPSERFARVAEYLVERGLSVVIVGGSRDVEEVTAMMQAVEKTKDIIDASETFSIDELKALIAQTALFVSVDTGPIYIAEAFGVPTVDIVGPMNENEQPPIGKRHLVVVPKRKKPELSVMNARMYNEKEAKRQVEDISVEMVCAEIDTLFSDR